MDSEDKALGMGRGISRRDFVNGVAVVAGAGGLLAQTACAPAGQTAGSWAGDKRTGTDYPPLRHGLRGDHSGSFENAPFMKDLVGGKDFPGAENTAEIYDLVVVGGGISGLAAAWFYRERAGPNAKILILENHDDFGGHAKRNEYVVNGHMMLFPGGSDYLVGMASWPHSATRLVKALGIEPGPSAGHADQDKIFQAHGLEDATFFDKQIYGKDMLIRGATPRKPTKEFLAKAPLAENVKADLARLMTDPAIDYLKGLSADEKVAKLRSITYRDYLLNIVKVHPDVLAYTGGVWCLSNDTATAWFAYFWEKPGFAGLGVKRPAGAPESPELNASNYYLPGGNHSVARLMVRSLIPDALPPGSPLDVETQRTNYAALDRPGQATRIRLNSTVIRAMHVGDVPRQFDPDSREVEVTYVNGGKAYKVVAKDVVMACMNNVIPYLCPELPDEQKMALKQAVRAINHTTNVCFRNWEAFAKLKVKNIKTPQTMYSHISLQQARICADLKPSMDPSQPVLVDFGGGPGISTEGYVRGIMGGELPPPGTSVRDYMRAARSGLLQTPFETFEREIRRLSAGALAGTDFDPARDILDITVNRWGHGYALGRNNLFDDESSVGAHVIGRQRFGRIAVANSDASGIDTAHCAIDEAARAVSDLERRNYGFYESI